MTLKYTNETALVGKEITKNTTRVRKIRGMYLITTDHGSWVALNKGEYGKFIRNELDGKLLRVLEKKGVIITPNNLNYIIRDSRLRLNNLFRGTELHIITTTKRCNQKCVYCHSAVKSKVDNEKEFDMDRKTARKTLEFIFQTPAKHITIEFQGGETLLTKDLFKFVVKEAKKMNKIHKKEVTFALVSNLTLMDEGIINWIKKENVTVCTSLDGPKEVHDKNRWFEGGNPSYDDVTKGVKQLRNKGIGLGMLMVTTKYSLPYWKEIVDEYVKWGATALQIKYINKIGFAETAWNQIGYTMEEFLDFWKKSVDYMIELNKKGIRIRERYVYLILQKILTKKDPNFLDFRNPTCGAVAGQMAYDHKGDIFSCDEGRMNKDMFGLGNVKDKKYTKVLSSEKAQVIMGASINDTYYACDKCAYKPWCGLCPVIAYAEQGNILPKVSDFSLHKLHLFQFDYVFEKLLYDPETRAVFFDWVSDWKSNDGLDIRLVKSLKKVYGLEINEANLIRKGMINKKILIKDGTKKLLLKLYHNWFKEDKENEEFVCSIIAWVNYLRSKKVEIGKIIPTKEGRNYFKTNSNFSILHEYLDGEKFSGTDKEIKSSSRKLAQMHGALEKYNVRMNTREFKKVFNCDKKLLNNLSPKYQKTINKALKEIKEVLKEINYSKLKKMYIHGDFSFGNIIYQEKKVKAIIDFDAIMYGPRTFDVGVALCYLIRYYDSGKFNKINLFYKEYINKINLNKIEKGTMITLMKAHFIEQISSRLKLGKPVKNGILELIKNLEWITTNEIKLKKYLN